MSNKVFIGLIAALLLFVLLPFIVVSRENNEPEREERSAARDLDAALASCMAGAGLVVYGTETCPACTQFALQFGGYDVVEPIFVECSENPEECEANMVTEFVPEVQFNGQVVEERSKAGLAELTGCPYDPEQV